MQRLSLPHGDLELPLFMPDATYGFVRALDAADLAAAGVGCLMMNAYHLAQKPGSTVVEAAGGLHAMYGWDRPICTDSGGFQAWSLLRENPNHGSFGPGGFTLHPPGSDKKRSVTPEKTIQQQLAFGADLLFTLDVCTAPDDPPEVQARSVDLTIQWAERCRETYDRIAKQKFRAGPRPLLFAVVQGGNVPELRARCAKALLAIGFDGYGFGGYPIDKEGKIVTAMIDCVRDAIPAEFPLFALGVGSFEGIRAFNERGFSIFDCSLPTRDARRGRLYRYEGGEVKRIYLEDEKHVRAAGPLSESCGGPCCGRPIAFLRHLFDREDALYYRLATIHNLRALSRFMADLARARPVP